MSTKIKTPFGHAAPPALGHSAGHEITTHMPTWQSTLDFVDRKPAVINGLVNMYPRILLQKDVKAVSSFLLLLLAL